LQASCKGDENAPSTTEVEKQAKEQASDGSKAAAKAGSKLNLSPQEVEEVLAVLRYRTRPATPPLKDQTNEPVSVNMALVKGPSLPKSFLEKGAKNKHLRESKETSTAHCVVNKADKLLQAILRPSQEGTAEAAEAQDKPTGLERLKHLFNKTISVSSKETAISEVSF
jgi:hypothetical protein